MNKAARPIRLGVLAAASLFVAALSFGEGISGEAPLFQKGYTKPSGGTLSVPFVANHGQTDREVAFFASARAGTTFVTRNGRIVHSLPGRSAPDRAHRNVSNWSLTESFVGGHAKPRAGTPAVTRVSYFLGDNPKDWRSEVPTHVSVELGEVWPGIGVSVVSKHGAVEKIFTVAPGASTSAIRMQVDGATSLGVGEDGKLIVGTGLGEVAFSRPLAYQDRSASRRPVAVSYWTTEKTYGFRLGTHDPTRAVHIDPELQVTYLGGNGFEGVGKLAIHPFTGEVLVAGGTTSPNFPGTAGGAQPVIGIGGNGFVARLSPDLSILLQATFVGDNGGGGINALTVHPLTGDIFVGGLTPSPAFPAVGGAQPAYGGGPNDGFLARLNSSLTAYLGGTYLGGSAADVVRNIAIHPSTGELFASGDTSSPNFPGISGGAQTTTSGGDVFLARVNQGLTSIGQATFLGGDDPEGGFGLAIAPASGEVFVTGTTRSTDFPGTGGGAQPSIAGPLGGNDAFVARLNRQLTALLQSTYFGGTDFDGGTGLAFLPNGDVVVAGGTGSRDLPGTAGAAQPAFGGGGEDAFLTRLNPSLTAVRQTTYLGGSNVDIGSAVAIGSTGEVFLAGFTTSTDFPRTSGGAQESAGGAEDVFVAKLNGTLTNLLQASYLGGSGQDLPNAIAIHPATLHVFVSGETASPDLQGTSGRAQPAYGGGLSDVFTARFNSALTGSVSAPSSIPTLSRTAMVILGGAFALIAALLLKAAPGDP